MKYVSSKQNACIPPQASDGVMIWDINNQGYIPMQALFLDADLVEHSLLEA